MAVINKQWSNGDALTLTTSAGGIAVSSAQNLSGADRQMTVQVRTTNAGAKVTRNILIRQAQKISKLYTWGTGADYQLGNGSSSNVNSPTLIEPNSNWSCVSVDYNHALGIKNGRLYSWGRNDQMQCTPYNTTDRQTPKEVDDSITGWTAVCAENNNGGGYSFAIKNGELYYFGMNMSSFFDLYQQVILQRVGSYNDHSHISAAQRVALTIRNGGQLYAMGSNMNGELGLGTTSYTEKPFTRVGTDTGWTQVVTTGATSFGIRNGRLYSWGSGRYYASGHGDTNTRTSPTQVGTDTGWTDITAFKGYYSNRKNAFALGIRNGRLYSWGGGVNYGALGLGSTTSASTPTQIGTDTNWEKVEAGSTHVLAIKGGELYAWGINYNACLGDPNLSLYHTQSTPLRIGTASDWQDVKAGVDVSFALKST